MRLATYRIGGGDVRFGVLREDRLHAFTDLDPDAAGHGLASVDDYLAGLPDTFDRAHALSQDAPAEGVRSADVRLLPAAPRPAALLDCGLSPRHLRASTATLLRHALPWGARPPRRTRRGRRTRPALLRRALLQGQPPHRQR